MAILILCGFVGMAFWIWCAKSAVARGRLKAGLMYSILTVLQFVLFGAAVIDYFGA